MKQHDTRDLVITCTDNGAVVDLTTATEIKVIGQQAGAPLFSRTTTGSSVGVVNYSLTAIDTAAAGVIQMEVQATLPGGKVNTYPESGYLTVEVIPDLG